MSYARPAQLFKAFSDENRLQILSMLKEGEKCACVILEELHISQSTLSHHMKLLCEAGIVSARKEGKWTHYSLDCAGIQSVKTELEQFVVAEVECCCERDNDTVSKAAPTKSCCASKDTKLNDEQKGLLQQVQDRYIMAAKSVAEGSKASCGPVNECCADAISGFAASDNLGAKLYDVQSNPDIDGLPEDALLASLGCGNPTAVADLKEGETVLDLGSGGGIDVLLSAAHVGKSGFAYGLDMTDEMLELARKNAKEANADNVEFLKGHIEAIPLADDSVDIVISNCVINLSVDKPAVFREMARVLKDGGRIGISDVVASNDLTKEQRLAKGDYTGCIAGALSFAEYEAGLRNAGFSDIEITPTHEVVDDMFASIIKAYIRG